jgi:drug/metabolite transporter (DMT)-like permease
MTLRRWIGLVLVAVGIVALVWGGVFWTDTETVLDAGPVEITAQEREGVQMPPLVGVLALIGGLVLLVVPDRRRTVA